jgi:SAM-dependent methyltransferase
VSSAPGHDHHHDARSYADTPAGWDERYAETERVWSGNPNGTLVTEVAGLPAGRALDVGCGEGADAVWLARQGWDVTALDVSHVALQRAAQHAEQAGVRVRWIHAGLLEAALSPGSFDLVSAQYPVLRRTPANDAERALCAAVAPGGTLLVVHHADMDPEEARARGFDPADYVQPAQVAAVLDDGWLVEVDETRPRSVESGAGAGHSVDQVLRARRLS